MKFNASKCVHLALRRNSQPQSDVTLKLEGVPIPRSNNVKYLGVTIQDSLKWSDHITLVSKKANKILGMLRRSLYGADSNTCILAYNTVVRPVMEYASQVWSPQTKSLSDSLEKINRRAVRWAYRVPRLGSISELMTNKCILSLSDRRDQLDLRFLAGVQLGDYDLQLKNYITFNTHHNTRGNTVNPHFHLNQFKFSYFNRMRSEVKVIFE